MNSEAQFIEKGLACCILRLLNFHLLQLFCVSKCSSQAYKVVHGPHEEIHSVGWKGLGDKRLKCVSCKALQTENSDLQLIVCV